MHHYKDGDRISRYSEGLLRDGQRTEEGRTKVCRRNKHELAGRMQGCWKDASKPSFNILLNAKD